MKIPLEQRFWPKVKKDGPPHPYNHALGPCWIWTGAKITDKSAKHFYGLIWNDAHTQRLRAHRVAWELTKGPIPKGKDILHSCDNPPCVNPGHLYPGDKADNARDMVLRGRALNGEKNPAAYLKEKQVRDILANYPAAKRSGPRPPEERKIIKALCKKHRITFPMASRIARRERWKHIQI